MNKDELGSRLHAQLRLVKEERAHAQRIGAARKELKRYQAARLAATHADLLAQADTHAAALFFLEELYGPVDLTQRDADLARIVPAMERLLPLQALHAITEAVALDALSERLDGAMAQQLGEQFGERDYAEAYRRTSADDRARQLDQVQALGMALCDLVRIPMLSMTLKMMRAPARVAGLGELQQFLERGFESFKKMRDARRFVETIVERERALMQAMYS